MNYLVADVPDRPVSVLIGLDLVNQLRKIAQRGLFRRDPEFRGVLYGRTDSTEGQRTLVTVESYEPEQGLVPVGVVRSWVRGQLQLDREDRSVLGGAQPVQPYSVLLVMRPARLRVPVAGAFLCESGAVTSEHSFVEFPLDCSRILPGPFTVLKDASAHVPETEQREISKRGPLRMPQWVWLPVAVAMLAIFVMTLRHGSSHGAAAPSINPPPGQARILLSLQRAGNDLLLRWDPDSPIVRTAAQAVLRITDGAIHRTVPLDSSQLQVGAAQYHPVSNDVEFQLDIPGANGATSGPLRFISGAPPQPSLAAKTSDPAGETAANGESDRTPVSRGRRSRPSQPTVQISYAPIAPSAMRKAVDKVRGVPLLRFRRGDFVPPRATHQVTPVVPAATARQWSGERRVELRVSIDKNGRVTNLQSVTSGADQHLVAMAESAIRRWQFSPARLNNRPVGSSVRFTVRVENAAGTNAFASR